VIFVQKEKEEEKCREFAKNHAAMSMEQNMAYLSSAKHANNYSCYFLFFLSVKLDLIDTKKHQKTQFE
jgi:hypothetical protein